MVEKKKIVGSDMMQTTIWSITMEKKNMFQSHNTKSLEFTKVFLDQVK